MMIYGTDQNVQKCPAGDKAITCPHCGYPFRYKKLLNNNKEKLINEKRLPNGFGTISELKNQNLRKPFRALVCVGKILWKTYL